MRRLVPQSAACACGGPSMMAASKPEQAQWSTDAALQRQDDSRGVLHSGALQGVNGSLDGQHRWTVVCASGGLQAILVNPMSLPGMCAAECGAVHGRRRRSGPLPASPTCRWARHACNLQQCRSSLVCSSVTPLFYSRQSQRAQLWQAQCRHSGQPARRSPGLRWRVPQPRWWPQVAWQQVGHPRSQPSSARPSLRLI